MSTTTLATLATMVGGRVEGDDQVTITGAASIGRAQKGDITLADAPRLVNQVTDCRASAVVVSPGFPATLMPTDCRGRRARGFRDRSSRIFARSTHSTCSGLQPRGAHRALGHSSPTMCRFTRSRRLART